MSMTSEMQAELDQLLKTGPAYWASGKRIEYTDIEHIPETVHSRGGVGVVAPAVRRAMIMILKTPEAAFTATGTIDDWFFFRTS